ncbi:hypothetical protein B0A48_16569 [Cryoendolithus antarcticus]|uniref:Uncharacterized protein n=1 Tax=Cryoendolithus antarcticus TaxID=1507870 RepID=A0A1V8SEL5_9PEZI|nr:hypothetical protein B0A48_16569 [Cryoendolithus antarcticus]
METIKNVVGYVYGGAKPAEGHEPVNAQQGTGKAGEPFDKGNVEDDELGGKAAPLAGATTTTSTTDSTAGATNPEIHEPAKDDATTEKEPWRAHTPRPSEQYPTRPTTAERQDEKAAASFSSEPIAENVQPETSLGAKALEPLTETTTEAPKAGGVGSSSWFATALPSLPFVGGKSKTAEEPAINEQTTPAVAEKDTSVVSESTPPAVTGTTPPTATEASPSAAQTSSEASSLPPNHLPVSVPVGASTDLLPNQSGTENATAAAAAASSTLTADAPNSEPSATSSTAAPHSSRFVESDTDAMPGKNPDALPTAGGQRIGSVAGVDAPSSSSATPATAESATAPATSTSSAAAAAPPMDSTQVSPKTSFTGTSSSTAVGSESKAAGTSSPAVKSAVPIVGGTGSGEKETSTGEEELHGKDKLKAKLHKLKEKIKH